MDAFRRHGGKIILYAGTADWAFPATGAEAYLARVEDRYGKDATSTFFRLFIVPGMLHGPSNFATDEFDAIGSLIAWVEHDAAPDVLQGKAGANSAWPGRTRPICSYPHEVTYKGQGDIERAENFFCQ